MLLLLRPGKDLYQLHCSCNISGRNFQAFNWNPWDGDIGMILVVSVAFWFLAGAHTQGVIRKGLEFVLQLCVEDDERAGTVLAVSNKGVIIQRI